MNRMRYVSSKRRPAVTSHAWKLDIPHYLCMASKEPFQLLERRRLFLPAFLGNFPFAWSVAFLSYTDTYFTGLDNNNNWYPDVTIALYRSPTKLQTKSTHLSRSISRLNLPSLGLRMYWSWSFCMAGSHGSLMWIIGTTVQRPRLLRYVGVVLLPASESQLTLSWLRRFYQRLYIRSHQI